MTVAIIGTVALDSIKTPSGEHNRILGGSATFSATAATIFGPAGIVSIVGKDFPSEHIEFFKSRNINLDGLHHSEGDTFHWKGYYEGDMNQAITVKTDLNVLLEFDPVIPDSLKKSPIVFMANVDPVLQEKAIRQFESPELVILDTMNFWIEHKLEALKQTLKLVDILIVNDQEIRQLTGDYNLITAISKAIELGPKRVVVKKGEHGAMMFDGTDFYMFPAYPLSNLVDPTGAGDSFAGAFAGYLSTQKSISDETYKQAVIAGTLVSSHTVQDFSLNSLKKITPEVLNQTFKAFKPLISHPTTI
ncbi:MAG: bifunctional hydroxymethylpyrimidine kinase/phosphomethylpyrimidine kinase [Candidatus Margulisbacteria bacterium]|nr:bifunctional hydroxymethylpyrimidine kinase/phosphomethylpyrimidine kinase [Candidatus Margulisiibacteriota bacterium]